MIKQMTGKLILISFICLYPLQVVLGAIAQSPLFLTQDVPPIVLLTMGRNHKLYYEAYNDTSDLNGDGALDIRYKPGTINYFGYFDSYKCYTYNESDNIFEPQAVTTATDKSCEGVSGDWSGDFLNYMTTVRIDALRKVLYGGYRSTDSETTSSGLGVTILERAYVPVDSHSWGKEYTSSEYDGYDISHYTPLVQPTANTRHFFVSTTYNHGQAPKLLILQNEPAPTRIWNWTSKEVPVITEILRGENEEIPDPEVYVTRVKVCVEDLLEANCKAYSWTDTDGNGMTYTTYKPTGILQKYGEEDLMDFGLLTGSFTNNLEGGVLRKNISSFKNEINLDTGQFEDVNGIVDTIDKLRIVGYSPTQYATGWVITRPINNGEAPDWGNPVAEMMYEGLRYFAGKSDPTETYTDGVTSSDTNSIDGAIGLPLPAWEDPYRDGAYERCAKPIQLVISDINPSYDTNKVPGHSFENSPSSPAAAFTGDLTALDVSALADIIWTGEDEANNIFIGESNGVSDGTPSAKTVSSFSNIRGMPDEPTKMGGFYASSIAYYGLMNDLSDTTDEQKVDTFSVALASAIPRFEIPVEVTNTDGDISTRVVTVVPFAKSVAGGNISNAEGDFQPTNQLVDFYITKVANTHTSNEDLTENGGRPYFHFFVNFEDVEQAADHDMDAIAEYEILVNADHTVNVNMRLEYAKGGIQQHMGYVISGTTADGTYLEIRDEDESTNGGDGIVNVSYFLNTPIEGSPGGPLPQHSERNFTTSSTASATYIKHDPLWYAAKWGGFDDVNNNDLPDDATSDAPSEWDTDNDGVPDNYFLVTNAGKFEEQLTKAFLAIVSKTSSSAAVATNSTRLDTNTKIYQARFDSDTWSGEFFAFNIDSDGNIGTKAWDASSLIPADNTSRKIYSFDRTNANSTIITPDTNMGMEFTWADLSAAQQALLNTDASGTADIAGSEKGEIRLNYIRGDDSNEGIDVGDFRVRSTLLGDVINSDPAFSGTTDNFGYSVLNGDEGETYRAFRIEKTKRAPAVFFGANDGMLHGINASDGTELFTYVPNEVIASLSKLTSPLYGCGAGNCLPHQYFVDGAPKVGDAYFGSTPTWHTVLVGSLGAGGKAIFALDVTNPDTVSDPDVSFDTFDESSVLWEVSTSQAYDAADLTEFEANLGYTLPQASVVRLNNGSWAAVVANGYESQEDKAVLFLLDIETGEIIKSFDTETGGSGNPNGLSTPLPIDINGDRITDYVYAGDLLGNMWKFDLTSSDSGDWDFAYKDTSVSPEVPLPLYNACNEDPCVTAQPITARPQVGRHSDGGLMVYFGTGKYYEVNDQVVGNSPQVQSLYGIRDNGAIVSGLDVLQEQTVVSETTLTFNSGTDNEYQVDSRVTSDTDTDYIGIDANGDGDYTDAGDTAPKEGWFMKLLSPNGAEGERMVVAPLLSGGRVVFVSLIPESDACGWGGTSWLMLFDAQSGSRLVAPVFDLNGDGYFNETDSGGEPLASSIRQKDMGIIKTPGVIATGDKRQTYFTSGTSGDMDDTDIKVDNLMGRQSWNQIR